MLRISEIGFAIQGTPLLSGASATIPAGHKVGLVGRNGSGKSTLFRLILGELVPESGEISLPRGARIGALAQEAPSGPESLLETVLAADGERARLMAEAESAREPERIAEIHARLSDIDAWSGEARAAAILSGLGFDAAAQGRPCSAFSGGWRMRVALAGLLFSRPDLLLLDEPTNYLDLEGTLWLESFLARYPHTVLVISHDRGLLNRAVGAILHLEGRKLTLWRGNYDQFERLYRARAEQAGAARRRQEARRAHLQSFVDRFRYKASKAKQAQARLKMIARMAPIELEEGGRSLRFDFPAPEVLAPPILRLDGVSVGYDGTPVLRGLNLRLDADDRIALLGANGEGKSTLSRLLAGELQPMEGEIHASSRLRIGYFAQHQLEALSPEETPLDHLRRALPDAPPGRLRARLAGFGLMAEQAETRVGRLSGGQKARLSLLLATLEAPHLLILDEPTNHLDIQSREALVAALTAYPGAVVLVSHDPHLIGLTADRLWLVQGGQVRDFDGDVEAYREKLLQERGPGAGTGTRREQAPARRRPGRRGQKTAPLKAEVSKCEARITRLEEMRARLDGLLADPALYAAPENPELARLQAKDRELRAAMERAEGLWLQALERLEAAGG